MRLAEKREHFAARRVTVTIVAVILVLSAEIGATLSATAARAPEPRHAATESRHAARIRVHALPPYSGEPHILPGSTGPGAARMAAVRFVRDYALWSGRSHPAIPAKDATRRVFG